MEKVEPLFKDNIKVHFARVVDYFSARLQVQERLCADIVNYLNQELQPKAIGILMKGEHLCKTMRGAKKQGVMTAQYAIGFPSDEFRKLASD